jgi:hypothetical protein
MGRRLVVQVVLDEGQGDDVFDQLAQVVCSARGVVGWRVERCAEDGEEQDGFGPAPGTGWAAFGELGAVSA